MPEPSLQTLLDQYGGEATSGHYGVQVVTTVDSLMQNAGVAANISPITMSTIAALEVAAHEVLTGGANLEALANLAIQAAMDLAGQLAAEALEAVVDVVPIIGAAFHFLLGINDAARERARAERIAQAKKDFADCRAIADRFEPVGSGPFSEVYPCDLFVQAAPIYEGWAVTNPPTVPYLGQMLRLMTESRWPGWLLHYLNVEGGQAANDPTVWGYQPDSPIWQNLRGSSSYPFNQSLPAGAGDWFPELGWYVPEFAKLRMAIRSMHPYERSAAGLPPGDGGKSLWALYQDLLFAVLYVPRHPFTDPGREQHPIKDPINFRSFEPVLPKAAGKAIYGCGILRQQDGEPYSLGRPRIFRVMDYLLSQGGEVPSVYWDRKVSACGGQPNKAVDAIYDMAQGWNLWTHPRHLTDQQKQADAIKKAASFASEFARARLAQLGVTKPSTGGPAAATQTITALAQQGVISDAQASEVAQAVNEGADSGRLALMLGAAAVGVGALAWVMA